MRISDWSSDVCSSDLGAPYSLAARRRNFQLSERTGFVFEAFPLKGKEISVFPAGRRVQMLWLSVYGIRARSRARLTAVARWRWSRELVPVMRPGTLLPFTVRFRPRVL